MKTWNDELYDLFLKIENIADEWSNPFRNDAGGSLVCHDIRVDAEKWLEKLRPFISVDDTSIEDLQNENWNNCTEEEKKNLQRFYETYFEDDKVRQVVIDEFGEHNLKTEVKKANLTLSKKEFEVLYSVIVRGDGRWKLYDEKEADIANNIMNKVGKIIDDEELWKNQVED